MVSGQLRQADQESDNSRVIGDPALSTVPCRLRPSAARSIAARGSMTASVDPMEERLDQVRLKIEGGERRPI